MLPCSQCLMAYEYASRRTLRPPLCQPSKNSPGVMVASISLPTAATYA